MAKPSVDNLIKRVQKTRHGFTDIKKAADELFARHPRDLVLEIAEELYPSGVYQARMLAVLLFARLAAESKESLKFLRARVSVDADWRVQEMLAQAFDRICADLGYEHAVPLIKEWIADSNPNVRRAASEGLRVWTARPYFREHPQTAIQLLSSMRGDESRYVRLSAGNALRDISRKHRDLISKELKGWNQGSKEVMQTYELAGELLSSRKLAKKAARKKIVKIRKKIVKIRKKKPKKIKSRR